MRRWLVSGGLVLLLPGVAAAQGISGAADWTYAQNTTSGGETTNRTGTFTQTYTAGYRSFLWDPRFMRYEGELILRRIGMSWNDREGHLSDTGYRFGTSLFAGRPFPLTFSALRNFGIESGNLPGGSALRGGLELPASGEMPELNTRTTNTTVTWQLDTPRLPRVELGYRKAASSISAGDRTVAQRDRMLSMLASRKTGPLTNELRFQKNRFENEFSTDFTQRLTELAYDGNAALGRSVRTTTRAGYRRTFSLFDVPVRMTDLGQQSFGAPSLGDYITRYAMQTVAWQPSHRLGTDVSLSYDMSSSTGVATRALLAAATVRYEALKGLRFDVIGANGTRTQEVRGTSVDAMTRSAAAGVSYASGVPHLQFGALARAGRGRATTADQQTGNTELWNTQASLSSDVLRWVDVGALYDKGQTTDELFTFGNYGFERRRLTARTRLWIRGSLEAEWEHSLQERGRAPDLFFSDLRSQNIGGTYMLTRAHRVGFNAGRYRAASQVDVDLTRFAGVNYEGQLTPLLRAAASFREEIGRRRTLDQNGYLFIAQLEYRVRLFMFGIEQRLTNIDYRVPNRDPFIYRGNSFLVRINRRFGWMF